MPEPSPHGGSSHTRRVFLGGSLATGLAFALPGCWGDDSGGQTGTTGAQAGAPRAGGRLRVGHVGGGTGETLMPHNLVAYVDAARAQNLYDGLTAFGPDNELEYRLAESMEPNSRGDVWQIKLRQGVTFHDGKPLTADDVIYTWNYMLNPDNTDFMSGTLAGVIDLKRTRKAGTHEVLAHLESPLGYLDELIALPWQMAIFPDGITTKELESAPNGTGPFKFESWTPGRRSLFSKNAEYWMSGKPHLDELEMISIPDNGARLNALVGGQIDLMEAPAFSQVQANEGNDALQVARTEGTGWVAFFMRVNTKPFTDKRVIKAFKLAVDRPKTIEIANLGFATLGNDVYGKGFASYQDPPEQHAYDPEQAKALLRDAGHPDGVDIELFTSTLGPGMQESAQAYVEQAKAAGIRVSLRNVPADNYFNAEQHYMKQPFYQTYWNSGSFEGITRLAMLQTASANETGWDRPDFDREFERASAILDPAERAAAMAPLQELVSEEGGYLIWSFLDSADLASSSLKGLVPSPNAPCGNYDFKNMWLSG